MPWMGYCSKGAVGAGDKVFSQDTRPSGSPAFVSLFALVLPYCKPRACFCFCVCVCGGSSKDAGPCCKFEMHSPVREWTQRDRVRRN